jgi:hypothetical protein
MSSAFQTRSTAVVLAVVAGVVIGAAAPRAQASEIDFSYTFADTQNVLSGAMDGTLQSDGNTFDVTSIAALDLNGTAVTIPSAVIGADLAFLGTNTLAAVSLDGSYMNLYAATSADAFVFAAGDLTADYFGSDLVAATTGYGSTGNLTTDYVQANWSASLVGVPEPATLALLLAPLGMLAWARTKRGGSRQA